LDSPTSQGLGYRHSHEQRQAQTEEQLLWPATPADFSKQTWKTSRKTHNMVVHCGANMG
jgi:hypothetical protein